MGDGTDLNVTAAIGLHYEALPQLAIILRFSRHRGSDIVRAVKAARAAKAGPERACVCRKQRQRQTRSGWLGASLLLAIVAACVPSDPPNPDAFRVALLTPGSIRDGGWNQGAYEGLIRIRDELDAEVAHQETRTPQEFEAGFRDFAARGFGLVFGHGFEFQDAAAIVSEEYPGTVFITTSGSTIKPNLAPIVFELEQATYVLGYVGASLSREARMGALGGIKIPSVASTFSAFEAGARAAGTGANLTVSYIGSWTDVAAAREATRAMIEEGCRRAGLAASVKSVSPPGMPTSPLHEATSSRPFVSVSQELV